MSEVSFSGAFTSSLGGLGETAGISGGTVVAVVVGGAACFGTAVAMVVEVEEAGRGFLPEGRRMKLIAPRTRAAAAPIKSFIVGGPRF